MLQDRQIDRMILKMQRLQSMYEGHLVSRVIYPEVTVEINGTKVLATEGMQWGQDFATATFSFTVNGILEGEKYYLTAQTGAPEHLVCINGKKVGISIKPKTPASAVIPYINDIDMVLVMTVEPGFGGQKFMSETMEKVTEIKEYAEKIGKELDIEVDGGINDQTIKIASDAGANIFVLGTAFFKSEKPILADEILDKAN